MADNAHSKPPAPHELQAHVEQPHGGHEKNPIEVDGKMVLWTWIVFGLMVVVLYKIAWKPILAALDQREKDIQDTIDNAEQVRAELAGIGQLRSETIAEADEKSRSILDAARQGAQEQARVIETKAREDTQIIQENASRDIETARAKAEATLKRESGDWAVELAGKILGENLDNAKNRNLTDRLVEEL